MLASAALEIIKALIPLVANQEKSSNKSKIIAIKNKLRKSNQKIFSILYGWKQLEIMV